MAKSPRSTASSRTTPGTPPPPSDGDTSHHTSDALPTLNITRVVLYKHGLGYFEMRGRIAGNTDISLFFPVRQMNDVLKSLSVLDPAGHVGAVEYENTAIANLDATGWTTGLDPTATLRRLLETTRGARVRVMFFGAEEGGPFATMVGRIMGLDVVRSAADAAKFGADADSDAGGMIVRAVDTLIVLADESRTIHQIPVSSLLSIEYLDLGFTHRLETFLQNTFAATRADAKAVSIAFRGEKVRDVFLCYTVEAPAWKTSYRLLVRDGKITLQGWALVDNATDRDWHGVKLSLVAGLPISFRYGLYPPLMMDRPEIEVQRSTGANVYESEEAKQLPARAPAASFGGAPLKMRKMKLMARRMDKDEAAGDDEELSVASMDMMEMEKERGGSLDDLASQTAQATGEKAGDFFAYDVKHPVTIRRNQSALVPIVQGVLTGEKVVIYNESTNPTHAMVGLRFTNSTGLTLDGGPATVFANDLYVGETMLPHLVPDEERLIAYAVDLGLRVFTERGSVKRTVSQVSLLSEYLRQTVRLDRTAKYTFKNKDTAEKVVILEHPKEQGWQLPEKFEVLETTENLYRIRKILPPSASVTVEVAEHRVDYDHVSFGQYSKTQLGKLVQDGLLAKAEREVLDKYLDLQEQIRELQLKQNSATAARTKLEKSQERQRSNMKALGNSAEEATLRKTYVLELTQQEAQFKELDKQIAEFEAQVKQIDAASRQLIRDFVKRK